MVNGIDVIGWGASAILLWTVLHQVRKQWREQRNAGVSRWLFAGQSLASVGFLAYSLLLDNWVFVATNGMLLLAALAGAWIQHRNRRLAAGREDGSGDARVPRDPAFRCRARLVAAEPAR